MNAAKEILTKKAYWGESKVNAFTSDLRDAAKGAMRDVSTAASNKLHAAGNYVNKKFDSAVDTVITQPFNHAKSAVGNSINTNIVQPYHNAMNSAHKTFNNAVDATGRAINTGADIAENAIMYSPLGVPISATVGAYRGAKNFRNTLHNKAEAYRRSQQPSVAMQKTSSEIASRFINV